MVVSRRQTAPLRAEILKQLRRVCIEARDASIPDDSLCMDGYAAGCPLAVTHCLAGHAALDPWFVSNTTVSELLRVERAGLDWVWSQGTASPTRLARVFALEPNEARDLFGLQPETLGLVPKTAILSRIDALLEGKTIAPYTTWRERRAKPPKRAKKKRRARSTTRLRITDSSDSLRRARRAATFWAPRYVVFETLR